VRLKVDQTFLEAGDDGKIDGVPYPTCFAAAFMANLKLSQEVGIECHQTAPNIRRMLTFKLDENPGDPQ